MKILITGKTSRIGNAFIEYMQMQHPGEMDISAVSLREDAWKAQDWSEYDAVLHAVGITKADTAKMDAEQERQYYEINRDLAIEAAKKAKSDGIHQFVLLSTMMVYGNAAPIGRSFSIKQDTVPNPASVYGSSKLEGEKGVLVFADDDFQVAVIREPVVYGPHVRGELQKLLEISKRLPVFPWIESTKSYIFEDNLFEFFRQILLHKKSGFFCPRNAEQPTTSELFGMMRKSQGKKCLYLHGFAGILKLLSHITGYVNAVFNDLHYEEALAQISGINYQICSLEESLNRCLK